MLCFKTHKILLSGLLLFSTACSYQNSIYDTLEPEQDGVISAEIPFDDGDVAPLPKEPLVLPNKLSSTETQLVKEWHEGEAEKISFIVVDAEEQKILRSFKAQVPQRLASVSKIPTAIAALENVNNISTTKVRNMLKSSNNGEASRYVRLAAKAIDSLVLNSSAYTVAHSCPSSFTKDQPAAEVALEWIQSELPSVDWQGASLNDGAGCDYGNAMTPLQITKVLDYAASKKAAYAGQEFEDLLSINGKDGTWASKNLEHKGYIFAKTGTLRTNGNLAGYFYAKRGSEMHKYYFSVFVSKKGSGVYSTRARRLIEELLRYWITYYSQHNGDSIAEF